MSSITTVLNTHHNLAVHTAIGSIRTTELIESIKAFYDNSDTVARLAIWDFSQASFENIESKDVPILSYLANRLSEQQNILQTALIFSSAEGYGLGRMFDSYRELDSAKNAVMCFREMDEALAWLGLKELQAEYCSRKEDTQ